MRPGMTVLTSLGLVLLAMTAEAAAHGGGHVASAPQAPHFTAPHFSEPMAPHFSQSMAPHFNQANVGRSGSARQGGVNPSYSQHNNIPPAGRYVNRTTTKLHALSNALQANHADTVHHSGSSSKGTGTSAKGKLSAGLASNAAGSVSGHGGGTGAKTVSAATSPTAKSALAAAASPSTNPSAGGTAATTAATSTTTTPGSAAASTGPSTPSGNLTTSGAKASTATAAGSGASTGTATTTAPSIGSITQANPNLTTSGNPTNFNSVTPTTFNPFGTAPILNPGLGLGYGGMFGLVSGPNGHHYYVYYPYSYGGYGYRNRYYGSGNYGNTNNSMYFAQMRRLSRLVNDLNNLTRGSNMAPAMSSRLRSDLMGVVNNNRWPPQQSVQRLSVDLATILPTRSVPAMNTGELAQHLMVVMNGGGQNMFNSQNSIAGAQGIMSMSGVPQQGIQTISSDLMTVATWGNAGNGLNAISQIR
jgi:hypothetical protein